MIIVEVGSINMDLVVRLPIIPALGETRMGGVFHTFPGGKGANQAVAAARLGAKVHMVGSIGADAFGNELTIKLNEETIDTRNVFVSDEASTGIALIQVDEKGQNTIAVADGANGRLTVEFVQNALKVIGKFDALMMPLEIPIEVVETAARTARDMGVRVVLNPAPARALSAELIGLTDLLIPNEHELALVSGMPIREPGDIDRAADSLHAQGLGTLVVTLGSRGAYVSSLETGERFTVPALQVPVVDTTAAGDCFVAALTVALCEGETIKGSVRFANAAAAISVGKSGAQPSLPYRNEVDRLMGKG